MIKLAPNICKLVRWVANMENTTLSKTDRNILAAMRADARMSITELAAATGTSRATAKTRLDALKASGRIRRFTIETDVDVEGEIRAISMIALQGKMPALNDRPTLNLVFLIDTSGSMDDASKLTKIPEVSTIYSTNGAWDLVVEIKTDSLVRFDYVLREIREVPGVLNSESCLLLSRVTS